MICSRLPYTFEAARAYGTEDSGRFPRGLSRKSRSPSKTFSAVMLKYPCLRDEPMGVLNEVVERARLAEIPPWGT